MKEPETKYLIDGSAVVVIETTKAGVICRRLYEHDGEPIESDDIICVPRVYDAAPVEKFDERVKFLESQIQELQTQRILLDQSQREAEAKQKAVQTKLARHDQLKTLMDYIDGKITHYVVERYWSWEIVPFNKALCHSEDYNKPLKLLTLFGSSNGKLDWNLNLYRDGSGHNDLVYPATSEAEALEILRRLILDQGRDRRTQCGVFDPLPPEPLQIVALPPYAFGQEVQDTWLKIADAVARVKIAG